MSERLSSLHSITRPHPTRIDDTLRRGWVVAYGALDLAFAGHLAAVLNTALADGPPCITLDLEHVWLMDATVIRVLVEFHGKALANDCAFRVAGAAGLVRWVMDLTGVLPMLSGSTVD
jgi:anti-anti-sigma factor